MTNKSKLTRNQMIKRLSILIRKNHEKAEDIKHPEYTQQVFRDIAFLAKCIRFVERSNPYNKVEVSTDNKVEINAGDKI